MQGSLSLISPRLMKMNVKKKSLGSCLSLEHIKIYVKMLDLNLSLAKIHKCQTIEQPMQSIKLPCYWV